jgi:hypothetical protein
MANFIKKTINYFRSFRELNKAIECRDVPAVLQLMYESDSDAFLEAARQTLVEFGVPETEQFLVALQSPRSYNRVNAAWVLREISPQFETGDPLITRVAEGLLAAMKEQDGKASFFKIDALGNVFDRVTDGTLRERIVHALQIAAHDEYGGYSATKILNRIGAEVKPVMERVEVEPAMERIREVHLFIEGGGDRTLVNEIIQALHPEFLRMPGLKIHKHDVTDWPAEPFYLAATDLRIHHGIKLTTTNCITQDGSAYGKRLYLIMVK